MTTFRKVVLYTDRDGRAKFREEKVALPEGTPQAMLSEVFAASGYQLRHSPVGFRSQWHCTPQPQWVFILGGRNGDRTAGRQRPASSSRASTFSPRTPCRTARPSIPRCTGTGARSAARTRW